MVFKRNYQYTIGPVTPSQKETISLVDGTPPRPPLHYTKPHLKLTPSKPNPNPTHENPNDELASSECARTAAG